MERERSGDFVVASLLTGYPDGSFREHAPMLLGDEGIELPGSVRGLIEKFSETEEKLDDLRSEYLSLFDSGRGVAPLYETEYGRQRAFFKANELAALSGFYHAFGFEQGGEGTAREMPDHLSVELEFYALLIMKEAHLSDTGKADGVEIVREARKKFLKEHLGKFLPALLARPGVAESESYGPILRFCRDLVTAECGQLGVTPDSVSWVDGEQEAGEVACGAGVGCLK